MRVIPGDPTITKLGGSIRDLDPQTLRDVRHQLGLDHSLPVQYERWVAGCCTGTSGCRTSASTPVTTLLGERIFPTLQLSLTAFALGVSFAVLAASLSAIWRNRFLDAALSGFTAIGMATPTFVLGILLIVVFSVKLNWLPAQGYVSIENDPVGEHEGGAAPGDNPRDRRRGADPPHPQDVARRGGLGGVHPDGRREGHDTPPGRVRAHAAERDASRP